MAKSLSLDELIALNAEIGGLVRSGVPLELGLSAWGRDMQGELGRMAVELSAASTQGQSLSEFLSSRQKEIPPVYGAVVAAGLRSGRLSEALESIATSARRLSEVRGAIGLAVLYPLLVLLVAYILAMMLLTRFLPAVAEMYEGRAPWWISALSEWGQRIDWRWIWLPPAAVISVVLLWWTRSRRAMILDAGSATRWLSVVPRAARLARNTRRAALAEIMALLVEHDVPLDEAVVLAAGCTGDRRLIAQSKEAAGAIQRGGHLESSLPPQAGFPPLVRWLAATRGSSATFAALARHAADNDRRRVLLDAQWMKDFLPMWLVLFVGVLVVMTYAFLVFGPFVDLLNVLTRMSPSLRIEP